MKACGRMLVPLAAFLVLPNGLSAMQPHAERGLWIELTEQGKKKTIIAMTEEIARALLESKEANVNFAGDDRKALITRAMLQCVLDGRQESVEARDPDDGSEAVICMRDLNVPGKGSAGDRLILATYKSGTETFRIALPEIEMESHDEDSNDFVKVNIGWKGLLPFLAKSGGAIYIDDESDDTEIWLYVD